MTRRNYAQVLTILLALLVVLPGNLRAQTDQTPSSQLPEAIIAVIDYHRIMREAKASQSIRSQIEAKRVVYQEELTAQEEMLVEEEQTLKKQRTLLSPEAFSEKRRVFEEKYGEVQQLVQSRRRELDRLTALATDQVKRVLITVVSGLVDEYGFNMVIAHSEVLFFSPRLDLTDRVLQQLDAQLPSIELAAFENAE